MSVFKSLEEILKIAERNPNQQIWCLSDDGSSDFITTALDIKNCQDHLNFSKISFGIIDSPDNSKEDTKENVKKIYHGKHSYQNSNNSIKIFYGTDLLRLEERINSFIENVNVLDIKCMTTKTELKKTVRGISKTQHEESTLYTTLYVMVVIYNG